MRATFDPRSPGPMKIVVEMATPSYCELKAVELITEARQGHGDRVEKLTQAMSLLALAVQQGAESEPP